MQPKLIVVALAALLALPLMAASAGASAPARVGCITPSEYEDVDMLGKNLTDSVASFGPLTVEPLTGDQAKPTETTLLMRRWGRLTRRFRGAYRRLAN